MFSCTTLSELDEVVHCFFILTNSMMTSDFVKEKYEKRQNWCQQNFEISDATSEFFANKTKDLQQEARSHFYFLNAGFSAIKHLSQPCG